MKATSNGSSLTKFGEERKKKILLDLESWGCMSIRQVQAMHFSHINDKNNAGYRKAHQVLYNLHKKKKVKRWRDEEGYVYSLEGRKGRSEHKLAINWVRVWFNKKLSATEKIHMWKYEDDYGFLRADSLIVVENKSFKTLKFTFHEMDCSINNAWDKIPKYNELFEKINKGEIERWWVKHIERFPLILIVTTSAARKVKIEEHIKNENKHGLRFAVKLLDDIKGEIKC